MQAGSGSGTGAAPIVTVTAGAAVTEDAAADFTLAADPAPAADLAVTVGQTGGYVASSARGKRTVTIPAGGTGAAFTVTTVGDEKDEPDGQVAATLEACTGCAVGESATASVRSATTTPPG